MKTPFQCHFMVPDPILLQFQSKDCSEMKFNGGKMLTESSTMIEASS